MQFDAALSDLESVSTTPKPELIRESPEAFPEPLFGPSYH